MKRFILLAAAVGAAVLLAAPSGVAQDLNRGARVYSENCGRCHTPRAPGEFSDRAWSVIVHHMHARGYLTASDTAAVLEFLRASNGTALELPTREHPASAKLDGSQLVAQKGCKGCHTIGGEGGKIGPVLDTVFQRRDDAFIMAKLTNPKADNPNSVMPQFGFSQREKEAIVAYLHKIAR